MILKPKGTVVLPRAAHDGLKILPWAKEVNRSLQQLRDRVMSVPKGRGGGGSAAVTLPFEISVTGTSLIAAAGVLDSTPISETVEAAPANGVWTLEAKVVIETTGGSVDTVSVIWSATPSSNTSTDFYLPIGEVEVIAGVPDASTIIQYTYGPLIVQAFGTPTNKWGVSIF